MLETAIVAAGVALVVSAAASFAMHWETRIRVARIERWINEEEEGAMRETKRRAAAASVAARANKANEFDRAVVAQHTGQDIGASSPDVGGMFDFVERARRKQ